MWHFVYVRWFEERQWDLRYAQAHGKPLPQILIVSYKVHTPLQGFVADRLRVSPPSISSKSKNQPLQCSLIFYTVVHCTWKQWYTVDARLFLIFRGNPPFPRMSLFPFWRIPSPLKCPPAFFNGKISWDFLNLSFPQIQPDPWKRTPTTILSNSMLNFKGYSHYQY